MSPFISGILEDWHMLNLAHRITNEQELRDLGTRALKVPEYITNAALYNHRTCIQDAAHEVLSTWRKQQVNDQEAYVDPADRTEK